MAVDPPSPEQIEAWIAGTLPADLAKQIEAFLEHHPEHLRNAPFEGDLLKEAAQLDQHDHPRLTTFIDSFKTQSCESQVEDQWMDLLEPTDHPEFIGTLEHYQVTEVLANTGMATVLKAIDPELNRTVAIKILSPALANHPKARERFLREARAMATLEHEHILPIYGIYPQSTPWFAMRYIEGGSLQDVLDADPHRLRDSAFLESLATQMASALSKAHAAGIIHRDIKPANILLDTSGDRMWLTDFGIASTIDDPGLTSEHLVAGTPRYMSPEQAAGEPLDHRTDLFSLGSVLYHCATGQPPFQGDCNTTLIDHVQHAQPTPARKLNRALPTWLSGCIDRLLEKDPAKRPANADELLTNIKARTRPPFKIHPWIFVALALFSIGLLTWHFWPDHHREETRAAEKGVIQNLETGQRYTDLYRALNEATSGNTLILDGWFLLEKPLITRTNFDLHLKAAEGASPTIEFKHHGDHGILVEGNASATGITFLCTERIEEGFQFLFIRDAGKVEVTDCTFDDRIPRGISWGVHGNATGQVVMNSCRFHGKELVACLLYDSRESTTARDGNLLMQDCTLEARAIALVRSRFPQSEFDITLKRNTLRGHTIIGFSKRNDLRTTRVTLLNNTFQVSSRHLHVANGSLAKFAETLQWHAEGNTYTEGTPFVRISSPDLHFIDTLDDFLKVIPNSRDSGARYHKGAQKQDQ